MDFAIFHLYSTTSWWLNQPHLKKYAHQNGFIFPPNFRGENSTRHPPQGPGQIPPPGNPTQLNPPTSRKKMRLALDHSPHPSSFLARLSGSNDTTEGWVFCRWVFTSQKSGIALFGPPKKSRRLGKKKHQLVTSWWLSFNPI